MILLDAYLDAYVTLRNVLAHRYSLTLVAIFIGAITKNRLADFAQIFYNSTY